MSAPDRLDVLQDELDRLTAEAERATGYERRRLWVDVRALRLVIDDAHAELRRAEARRIERESAAAPTAPATLDELLNVLRGLPPQPERADYCRAHGLPVACDRCDWSRLPTYGGEEPAGARYGVWSWDETRVLVGSCVSDLRIVSRSEWAKRGTR